MPSIVQIEEELLAINFVCSKFHHGFQTKVHSDYKPLETILKQLLHQISPRLQRMVLCLQKYDLDIKYVSGKHLYVVDTLSRAHFAGCSEYIDSTEIQLAVHTIVKIFQSQRRDLQTSNLPPNLTHSYSV